MQKLNIPKQVIDLLLCPELKGMPPALREDFVSCVTFSFIEIAEQAGHVVDYQEIIAKTIALYRENFNRSSPIH